MNLHAIVAPYIGAVNPLSLVGIRISAGSTTGANGVPVPNYETPGALTASITAGVLNATAIMAGILKPAQTIVGAGVLAGNMITAQLSGARGGIGTYSLSQVQDLGSVAMATNLALLAQIQPMTKSDLMQIEGLNLNGDKKAIYLNGAIDGVVRVRLKGGDLYSTFRTGRRGWWFRIWKASTRPQAGRRPRWFFRMGVKKMKTFKMIFAAALIGLLTALSGAAIAQGIPGQAMVPIGNCQIGSSALGSAVALSKCVRASFTASAGSPSTKLVVTSVTGIILPGDQIVSGTGLTAGTIVVSQDPGGTTGGAGTYNLSAANTASSASSTSGGIPPGATAAFLQAETADVRYRDRRRRADRLDRQHRDARHPGHLLSRNALEAAVHRRLREPAPRRGVLPLMSIAPTQDDVMTALRSFMLDRLPAGVDVVQGVVNRVAEPAEPNFAVMTLIRANRIETNVDTNQDVRFTGTIAPEVADFTASIDPAPGQPGVMPSGIMTVTAVSAGSIAIGSLVAGGGVLGATFVTGQESGSAGGPGLYTVSVAQEVLSGALTAAYGLLTVRRERVRADRGGRERLRTGVATGTTVRQFGTGTGGNGTYVVSPSQAVGPVTMSAGGKTIRQNSVFTVQLDFHSGEFDDRRRHGADDRDRVPGPVRGRLLRRSKRRRDLPAFRGRSEVCAVSERESAI